MQVIIAIYTLFIDCRIHTLLGHNVHNVDSDALRDLVPFAQFKKRGKHPWRNVTFSKVAGFIRQLY